MLKAFVIPWCESGGHPYESALEIEGHPLSSQTHMQIRPCEPFLLPSHVLALDRQRRNSTESFLRSADNHYDVRRMVAIGSLVVIIFVLYDDCCCHYHSH